MSRPANRASAFPRQAFDRVASRYDDHAALINEVGKRLLERLDGLNFTPTRILDLGCATGYQCLALHERFPHAGIIGLDPSGPMLAQARRKRGRWRRRFELVAGALPHLPLAADSIDLVYANLSLHHCQEIAAALAGTRRVLRPGGLLLLSVPGMDTLKELRLAWHRVAPEALRVMPFTDAQRLGTALTQAGFAEPVIDTDWLQNRFPHPRLLLEMLQGMGFVNQHPQRPRGLMTARQVDKLLRALSDQADAENGIGVSWEAVYASAWAPEHGQPLRFGGIDEVSIPIDRIPVRRRDP
ncbi:MAG: methyltransferase domain-containing protein [Wenzhouxiangella sp.]|nr:methyltransferase domain-containing protein [Wenzhouxiangella sp.]